MTPTLALIDGLGGPEILVIGVLALLLFGSKRLPELGRAFGRAMREFKRATSGVEENLREVMRDIPPPPTLKSPPRQVSRGATPAASALPATAAPDPPSILPPAATPTMTSSDHAPSAPPASPTPVPPPEKNPGAEDEVAS